MVLKRLESVELSRLVWRSWAPPKPARRCNTQAPVKRKTAGASSFPPVAQSAEQPRSRSSCAEDPGSKPGRGNPPHITVAVSVRRLTAPKRRKVCWRSENQPCRGHANREGHKDVAMNPRHRAESETPGNGQVVDPAPQITSRSIWYTPNRGNYHRVPLLLPKAGSTKSPSVQ